MPRQTYKLFKGDSCITGTGLVDDIPNLMLTPVTYHNTMLYRDLICDHYSLPVIPIVFTGRMEGIYRGYYQYKHNPEKRFRYTKSNKQILIHYWGENAETVLHELAHYVAHAKDGTCGHDRNFANKFKEVVDLYKKYLT